jgi:hypothetical protein
MSLPDLMTYGDFLGWRKQCSDFKHEYAMHRMWPVTANRHRNTTIALIDRLRILLSANFDFYIHGPSALQLDHEQALFYPALYAERRKTLRDNIEQPVLVVEMINDANKAFVRDVKMDIYRKVRSVELVMLVHCELPTIGIFWPELPRHGQKDAWGGSAFTGEQHFTHERLPGIQFSLVDLYRGLLPADGAQERRAEAALAGVDLCSKALLHIKVVAGMTDMTALR